MAKKKTDTVKKPKASKKGVTEVDVSGGIEIPKFNPYAHIDAEIDSMEKKFKLSSMAIDKDEPRFSTGLLSLDVALAGGLLGGGWYTVFGGEQSCKSTGAMTILSSIMSQKDFVGKAAYFDYEGCVSADTEVITPEGPMPLRDLLPDELPEEGVAFDLPMEVESVDGMQKSQSVFNKGVRPITKVTTETGKFLRGFKHPVYTLRYGSLWWVLMEDLQEGDHVVVKGTGYSGKNAFLQTHGLTTERVDSVVPDGEERVWDLSLNDPAMALPHSFLANGFVTHNSSQADYIENIMGSMGVKDDVDRVFGVRDDQTGEWVVKPRVRYYAPDTGEKFFHYLAKMGKLLPDKVRMGDQWYFVYDNNKVNQKALKGLYDKKYFSKTNRYRVPAPDGTIQAVILTDSYPAMLPGIADEKEEGDKSLALQARMFSDGLKRVKGMMRSKRIVVLGVNQLRKVPMAMYGPSETEPCGDALKFYSDVRLRMSSVSIPHGKGVVEEEDSVVADGKDSYRYIKIRTHKNKLGGVPNQAITMRLVIENGEGDATGFCHVWDSYQYLKITGQVGGTRKKIKFLSGFTVVKRDKRTKKETEHTVEFKSPMEGKTLDWMQFKTLIEGDKSEIRELCADLGMKKPIIFRNFLRQQVNSGKGYQYVIDHKRAANSSASKKEKDGEEFDADDDE